MSFAFASLATALAIAAATTNVSSFASFVIVSAKSEKEVKEEVKNKFDNAISKFIFLSHF
jgi:hypothetical protein